MPWYKLVPVRLFCTTCGAEVQSVLLSSRMWPVLAIWIVILLGVFWGLIELRDSHAISAKAFQIAGLALAFILWAGGMQIFRFFVEYKVVPPEA